MLKETNNPFLVDQSGIKTSGFRGYTILNQFKTKETSSHFVKEVLIDESMVITSIEHGLLISLSSGSHTKNTLSLFFILLSKLKHNEDTVILKTNDIAEKSGYKKSSVNKAINDLVDLKIISKISGRGNRYKYFINPLKVFKGNNIEFILNRNPNLVKSNYTINKVYP